MLEAARQLRKRETRGEQILWQALRNRKAGGRKFRRQQPIGAFVVDFFCSSERLVVEIDGPIHNDLREADAERQAIIESTGVRFVRLSSELAASNVQEALRQIEAAFGSTMPPQG
jgi:very-short-patch-repair endonuclease